MKHKNFRVIYINQRSCLSADREAFYAEFFACPAFLRGDKKTIKNIHMKT